MHVEFLASLTSTIARLENCTSHRGVEAEVKQCKKPIQDFQRKIEKYEKDLGTRITLAANSKRRLTSTTRSTKARIRWALSAEKDVVELRNAIGQHLDVIKITLGLNTHVLAGKFQITTNHRSPYLLNHYLWKQLIRPGSKVVMNVDFDSISTQSPKCPKCRAELQSHETDIAVGDVKYEECLMLSKDLAELPDPATSIRAELMEGSARVFLTGLPQQPYVAEWREYKTEDSVGPNDPILVNLREIRGDSIQVFRRIHLTSKCTDTAFPYMRMILTAPRGKRQSGFIYAFRNPEYPTLMKIGITKGPIENVLETGKGIAICASSYLD
ncbi:MAG: hypothetical protein MMC33_003282 [Icmadophila ericetorum]|nr:hypothetical protein [Icmadophila ericetorum]